MTDPLALARAQTVRQMDELYRRLDAAVFLNEVRMAQGELSSDGVAALQRARWDVMDAMGIGVDSGGARE
jgi:Tfp pilus assembly protein PilN